MPVQYQFPLLLLTFLAGSGVTVTCRCRPPGHRILARSCNILTARIERRQQEWATIESRARLLAVQIAAIALVSFAAPFRPGRAIANLRRGACPGHLA